MKFKSIRNRIVFTYVGVFLGTLLLLNIMIYVFSAGMIIRSKKEILETNRAYFIESMEDLHRGKRVVSQERIEEEMADIREHSGNFFIKISVGDREAGGLPLEVEESVKGSRKTVLIDGEGREEYFYLSETYVYEGSKYFIEYVLVADYEEYLKILVRVLVIVELLGLVISLGAGIKTGNSLVKPITEISDITERITSENLSERLPLEGEEDELVRLSRLINNALERLETSFENQRKFISNISHELRTPIAVMKGYLDIYRRMGGQDEALVEEAIGAIEEENENMRRMIDKLLFLARGDLEGFKVEKARVNGQELLNKLRRDYSSFGEGPGINLNIKREMKVFCDQNMVLQMLRSLVDNAIKYGGDDGIEIGGYNDERRDVLYVRDFGSGMTAGEKQKVFERFYRGDSARNRDEGSLGLGLSIVSKLAEIHGAAVEVESEVGVGSTFRIVFQREESE